MNEHRSFDWPGFITRVSVIVGLATWLLIGSVKGGYPVRAALIIGIGYVLLPGLAYIQARYRH